MAEQDQNNHGLINGTQNSFVKGMNRDLINFLSSPEQWITAKNMVVNTQQGDALTLSTESANKLCVTLPYQIIGAIPLDGVEWMIFCTDNINSEIGIINTDNCTYTRFSNTVCLNFKQTNLITGAARRNSDCGFNVYWSDGGLNPDRYVDTNTQNITNNIWIQNCIVTSTCTTCTNTTTLNCDNIRIAPLVTIPCLSLNKSTSAGTLLNGSYQVALAYAINGVKVTDYVVLSNMQSLFSHNNIAGSLTLTITNADLIHFKEMIITVITYYNGQLVAKQLGIYDTTEKTIYISNIDPTLPTVDLTTIPLQNVHVEKSDSIWAVNTYLLRNGLYEKPDFNYQPLANQIRSFWKLTKYPEEYYRGTVRSSATTLFSGNNYSYLQDEQYCFFIRWIYNTGDKSASYHIPGRSYDPTYDSGWQNRNTAYITSLATTVLSDGGLVVASGRMGYWESTDRYPGNNANIWSVNCGLPIRHHKMPDQSINNVLSHFNNNKEIFILGVQFDNIQPPVDINGIPISTIVGYEILRGSREGNKSIIAKGILNNMCQYTIPGTSQNFTPQYGLFQNYPANDLRPDNYLTGDVGLVNIGGTDGNRFPLGGNLSNTVGTQIKFDVYSFHSPDTTFQHPYLGNPYLKVYQEFDGMQDGYFTEPFKHPMFKVPTNFDSALAGLIGIANTISLFLGALGGLNVTLQGTDKLPINTPLFVNPNYAEGTAGGLAYGLYAAQLIYNATIAGLMSIINYHTVYQQILNVISGLIPGVQYARQFNGHAYYNTPATLFAPDNSLLGTGNVRQVVDYQYVEGDVQTFANYQVNNLFRGNYVALQLRGNLPRPRLQDKTRYTLTQFPGSQDQNVKGSTTLRYTDTSTLYAGLKVAFPSQYGQIGSVRELPIASCIMPKTQRVTDVLFGGDTYVNRYTEKNPFFFFNDWLIEVPEDYNYNYRNYINVPYPAFWVDNTKMYEGIASIAQDYRRLDGPVNWTVFYVKKGHFYLFCNGVRDFYVESEVNVGFRDWGDSIAERFYDPYGFTDLSYMFRSDIIKSNQFYKYDYSLSISKFYTQYTTFGQTLDRDFDPLLAATCFNYFPRRVAYSLSQQEEFKGDNWRQFLPNNYYDFPTPLRVVKPVSKTGALFMMDEQSPVEFTGTQVLQQGDSAKAAITIGDGGLFNQPLQNVVNTDKGLNYGSCKSKWSSLNTPYGLFWVSQDAGKIFQHAGQITEISSFGLKWWFAKYLPSQLLQQFPTYTYKDNPVIGIGIQCSYDETYNTLYVSKKDYRLKDQFLLRVRLSGNIFYYTPSLFSTLRIPISITDTQYFDNTSFTVSYNCREKYWISYHSWFPQFSLSARNHNITNKFNKLYTHNNRTDLFANFYGVNYETSIAFNVNTQMAVETLKNVEYYLETYYYQPNGWDRFQYYDKNWDNAIIWNNEQLSGILNLIKKPVNPYLEIGYPIINSSSIDVLYSMKEHKYRFSQFFDITKDRGEYSATLTQMFNTSYNGVDFSINPLYVDYTKPEFQRKKFRNYNNTVYLRKNISDVERMNFRMAKTTQQESNR